jgi:hypothetical protein
METFQKPQSKNPSIVKENIMADNPPKTILKEKKEKKSIKEFDDEPTNKKEKSIDSFEEMLNDDDDEEIEEVTEKSPINKHEITEKKETSNKNQELVNTEKKALDNGEVTPIRTPNLKKRTFEEFKESTILEKVILKPPLTLKSIKLKTKDFYDYKSIDFILENICETIPFKDNNDGIIITRINYPYFAGKSNGILKWKPDELNSIDFLVIENRTPLKKLSNVEGTLFELFCVSNSNIFLFDYMFSTPKEAEKIKSHFKTFDIFEKKVTGAILEMVYNKTKFNPLQSKNQLFLELIEQKNFIKSISISRRSQSKNY